MKAVLSQMRVKNIERIAWSKLWPKNGTNEEQQNEVKGHLMLKSYAD